ncbi:MAG: bifunctional protein-serine/threonine kinase/phosphatase [Gammaproteobacteria bacterium]|nr:MAG: bifunctional protein-serine/threonine kinase/phosphatase [Gammaproteobacteria bacterium]
MAPVSIRLLQVNTVITQADKLQIRSGFASETGKRETNEDYLAVFDANAQPHILQGSVAAIADGMGGALGGRQAAETTVRGFIDAYYSLPETLGVDRAAARAIMAMNRWVHNQRRNDPNLKDMATTFSALILRGRQTYIIHIGDTRIYRLRQQRLQRLTSDHIHQHPDMQHVLHRAIGFDEGAHLDCEKHSLMLHDRFLLCSDGVHGVLSDRRIQAILDEGSSPEDTARRIVESALQAGSQDNVSGLVVDVVALPPPDQSDLMAATADLPVEPLPKSGEEIDGFKLQEMIFDARNSRLFRAQDKADQREVVLKFPHPRICDDDTHRQAFTREAWIAARVHSPWVIETIELPPDRQSRLYAVMPSYRGETLEQRLLREPRLTLEAGVEIGIKLAKAVYSLNRRRIFHRDIKPENVMLLDDGGLKLLDLGVARLPGIEDDSGQGAPGTPSYMAPELYRGAAGDEHSEVYALGVTLYRMFSAGHYPYGEVEAFSRPRQTKYTPLSQHRPDLPAWLDMVLDRASAPDPAKRFADVLELAYELEDGLSRGAKITPQAKPLMERDPVLFWKGISFVLAVILFAMLTQLA